MNLADAAFEYDPEDTEGFRAGRWQPGPGLGADRTGVSVYELPPGQAVCPYHYELAEEEWLLVARVLLFSNLSELGATVYPDSDKIGIYPPGQRNLFRRSDAVDYYEGEE